MRILLLFLFCTNTVFAQTPPVTEEKIYEVFDLTKPPQFPGGEQALLKFLAANIQMPVIQDYENFPGKIIATFIVNKDGSIVEVKIIKGEEKFGNEVKRVISSMPLWSPGEINGQAVRTKIALPVWPHPDQSEFARSLSSVLRHLDSATVWEGVRIKTEQIFGEKRVEPSFRIKNKSKRKKLVSALEGQFQVNISEQDMRSLKRAKDLSNYIFQAQQGIVMFSKANFQGKVERLATDREECKEDADCLNFIGALIVPKGFRVTLFNQPDFKGEQLVVNASKEEVRIASLFNITFEGAVSTTDKAVNWREETRSLRILRVEN